MSVREIDLTPSDDPRGRSKHDRIRRLRERVRQAAGVEDLKGIILGVLDLLEDEL